jgi:hypothetical protein
MSKPTPSVGAQTLLRQGPVNLVVRGLLCASLLGRLLRRRLVTVCVVGRRSGRHRAVPVAYILGTQFSWARNVRTGDPVQVGLLAPPGPPSLRYPRKGLP